MDPIVLLNGVFHILGCLASLVMLGSGLITLPGLRGGDIFAERCSATRFLSIILGRVVGATRVVRF